MLLWTIVVIGLVCIFALNIFGTNTVLSSYVNTDAAKQKLIWLIWLLPYFGTILAMVLVNKAIKNNTNKVKDNMASSLTNMADRFNTMEKEIRQKQTKSANRG